MLVFYSGWGYWALEPNEFGLSGRSRCKKVCCLFKLPKDAEMEIKYNKKAIVHKLLQSPINGIEIAPIENSDYLDSEPYFVMCREKTAEELKANFDGTYCIESEKTYTSDDVVKESFEENTLKIQNDCEQSPSLILAKYLDQNHPMFSKELSIAIQAWNNVLECNPVKPKTGSRKQLLEKWLETSHPTLSKEARNRITTLLNPDKNGGAPSSE